MFFVSTIHVELSNIANAELIFPKLNLVCVGSELGCESADMVGECGGKEDDLHFDCTRHHAAQLRYQYR